MGGMFGGGGSKTTVQNDSTPWYGQMPYMTAGYAAARGALDQAQAQGPFTGNITAGPNGYQTAAEQSAANFANGLGADLTNQTGGTAGTLMGAAPGYLNNAANLAANGSGVLNSPLYKALEGYGSGANTTLGANPELSAALNNAAINGANSLNGFTNNLGTISNTALSDPTQRIGNDAAAYANNPGVQAAINSTNKQLQQVLNEQTLPGLNRAEAASGNLNSSRAGMQEAMAREGEAIAQGNADASILNNAYNTGMNTAAGLYSSGLNTANQANTSGLFDVGMNTNNVANRQQALNEFNTNTQLGAANSGLADVLANANTQLGANAQLGQGAGLGLSAANAAGRLAAGDFGLLSGAGQEQQQGEQALLKNALQQYQLEEAYPFRGLGDYWSIVGNNNGQSQTGTTNNALSGPGLAGGLLGTGLAAYGLLGGTGVGSWLGGLFSSAAAAL